MTLSPSTVHIVDDDDSVREALSDLLESMGIQSILYDSAHDFISKYQENGPSCLILDIRMPGKSGLELQQDLTASRITLPIIFITAHGDIPMSVRALKNGAVDFLTKPFSDQTLLDAIHHALQKSQKEHHHLTAFNTLMQHYRSLNQGEKDVLALVTQGLMNKQIAHQLSVSEITVKVRRSNIMKKMGAKSLVDLVRYYDELKKNI